MRILNSDLDQVCWQKTSRSAVPTCVLWTHRLDKITYYNCYVQHTLLSNYIMFIPREHTLSVWITCKKLLWSIKLDSTLTLCNVLFIAGPNGTAAPKWGYPGNCDANILMINNMFSHISTSNQNVSHQKMLIKTI